MSRSRIINLANFQQFTAINALSDPGHIGGPVVIPNGVRVLLKWTLEDGKIVTNVMGGLVSGGFTPTVAMCTAILNALTTGAQWTALAAFFPTTQGLSQVQILDIRTPNNAIVSTPLAGAAGTSASPALPNETALVITLRTALTGPQNRGRIYIPAWATNALGTGNVAAAAAVTALGNWANNIAPALTAQGIQFSVAKPARAAYTGATGTSHPARSASMQPITSTTVRDNHWDSQRRRGLK